MQRPHNAVLPSVQRGVIEVEVRHHIHHVRHGHTLAQHAADQDRVVPELLVKASAQAFDGHTVIVSIGALQVVDVLARLRVASLDHPGLVHRSWQLERALRLAREDLIGLSLQQAHYGDPGFRIVVEAQHIGLQSLRTCDVVHNFRRTVLFRGHEHATARSVTVYCDALRSEVPCFQVDPAHLFHRGGGRQVDGTADRVRGELLNDALHAHAPVPVDVAGGVVRVRAFLQVLPARRFLPIQQAWMMYCELLPLFAEVIGEAHHRVPITG